jgi:hypothetical protein
MYYIAKVVTETVRRDISCLVVQCDSLRSFEMTMVEDVPEERGYYLAQGRGGNERRRHECNYDCKVVTADAGVGVYLQFRHVSWGRVSRIKLDRSRPDDR